MNIGEEFHMKRVALVSYNYPPTYSGYGNQARAIIEEISRQCSDIGFIVITWNLGNELSSTTQLRTAR